MSTMFKKLCESRLLSLAGYLAALAVPPMGRIRKYRNILIAAYSINRRRTRALNNPIRLRIAPSAVCNYLCVFCEIHKDNLLYPDRSGNFITLDTVANYDSFLSSAYTLAFFGGSAEPLLNKKLGAIIDRLKSKYGLRMTANTNASAMTRKLSDVLVGRGFDELLISYHAASANGYKAIMTGDVERVDENIAYLGKKKAEMGRAKPRLVFNFAPQKLNAPEGRAIIDKAAALGVDAVLVSRYHGGRNLLQDRDMDFHDDAGAGNAFLDAFYAYAAERGVSLVPPKPRYFSEPKEIRWQKENYDRSLQCHQPWTDLYLEPVLDAPNSHYVRVCNRSTLFKIRFDELPLAGQADFERLWNHPMLGFMRETVNSDRINSLCKYCKNIDRREIRNLDHHRYAEIRDGAMADFYREFRVRHPDSGEIPGLEVLKGHPYSERDYINALAKENAPAVD